MRVFITGIAGLIGSHLAEALINQGHEVCGNDNLICGSRANVPLQAKTWDVDCRDFDNLSFYMDGIDVVVHAAATAAEGFSVFSPNFITRNIAEASVSTFSAAISKGVKRIIYLSSMARYGKGNPPFVETDQTAPIDPYANAKVYAENQLKILCNTHDVKWSILVPHNVFGTRQEITPYRNVVTIFLNRLKLGLPVYIYGDGNQKRSFSPIKDCLPSLVKVVNGAADGQIVNIGPDMNEMTINSILDICEECTGIKASRIYLPPRPVTDDVQEAYCSSAKARQMLGFEPKQSILDCIREMAADIKPKPFSYSFPVEIDSPKLPRTWAEKL